VSENSPHENGKASRDYPDPAALSKVKTREKSVWIEQRGSRKKSAFSGEQGAGQNAREGGSPK